MVPLSLRIFTSSPVTGHDFPIPVPFEGGAVACPVFLRIVHLKPSTAVARTPGRKRKEATAAKKTAPTRQSPVPRAKRYAATIDAMNSTRMRSECTKSVP